MSIFTLPMTPEEHDIVSAQKVIADLRAALAASEARVGELENWKREGADQIVLLTREIVAHMDRIAELEAALEIAVNVSGEVYVQWDEAPSSMKPGKLLVALTDPFLNYRADITAMHAVRTRVRELLAEDDDK